MWVPVLIMSGFGRGAVDAREESGLGEVHLFGIQTKRLCYCLLNSATDIPVQFKIFFRKNIPYLILKISGDKKTDDKVNR